jgi:glutamate racemase
MVPMAREASPIGVFDSGVGGLTVFREIARALPHHSLIYLGDSARVPYGTKSAETVTRYSLEAAAHLLDRGIGMLVVACNTATAAALPALQAQLSIPVIGVVEPGARAAVERTRGRVGVIATEGTVRSKAYTRAIKSLDPKIEVIESAAPLFVSLAEEGWANTHVARSTWSRCSTRRLIRWSSVARTIRSFAGRSSRWWEKTWPSSTARRRRRHASIRRSIRDQAAKRSTRFSSPTPRRDSGGLPASF